ncbi:DEAD box RNA helicase [Operophtera brumata]|uniref:RNA helicase n=1 Tax=Operophtera brumata TaxID=104452 RepID=A0A0L7LDN9_OPEBR|nr:DEAD box RNA helicase [Operophtera brumata]
MQKRRERIERWRADRKRKEIDQAKKEVQKGSIVTSIQLPISKKWSLEDDSGDEGVLDSEAKEKQAAEEKRLEEEEIDPLDAYMQEVQQEVRKVNQLDQSRGILSVPTQGGTGIVILTGTAKKMVKEQKNKGELIEQNQDGLEYSSEEETEDIKDQAANLASKQRKDLAKAPLEDTDGPIALIMTPTRELCMQIGKDIKKFAKSLGLRVVCVYGGTGISEQIAELKRGAEMIVCTPGRMIDMLAANSGRVTNLRRVTYIVLDEADRIIVCKEVEQHVAVLEDDAKFFKLLELLGLYSQMGSIIVFVDKQENADSLLKDLMKASYQCMSLHGGIDQFDRDSTIVDFKNGKVRLLVATSVAARGLDVKQLVLVVNYDCPNHYEDYVHRSQGRYAGDVLRAFELAGTTAPPELRRLWETYKEAQEKDGKKAQAATDKKKYQKAALGLQDSDDEDVEGDLDQQIETMFAAKKIAKTVAEQLAAKLNTRLNYQPRDESANEPAEEVFKKYETELEINDFPQQARWREALALISEYSEAGITVRGTYVPPGKNPPEGERKLYLAIESSQELAVAKAKSEITRLIKEELLKLQTSSHHTVNKARYKVC